MFNSNGLKTAQSIWSTIAVICFCFIDTTCPQDHQLSIDNQGESEQNIEICNEKNQTISNVFLFFKATSPSIYTLFL